uniref:Uncharacterized protein n=1 Tax=viral metagenome TaxID=1070528 RepID=A0A6M3KB39_9ZZZZ
MANLRAEILRRVFREGVKSVPKKTLDKLFKSKNKLYRMDMHPEELLREGWNPRRRNYFSNPGDPAGIFWSPSKRSNAYYNKEMEGAYDDPVSSKILGIPHPDARYKDIVLDPSTLSGRELVETLTPIKNKYGTDWPPEAAEAARALYTKKADFLRRSYPKENFEEVLQVSPNQVLAKIKGKYRILGLGGALGVGGSQMAGLFEPSEAQAFPIGKMVKAVSRKALGSLSSSSESLAGKTLQNKVIKEVRRGHGNWREVIFNDGTALPMTKDYVNKLCRTKGTDDMLEVLSTKGQSEQLKQALRSMKYHEDRLSPGLETRPTVAQFHESYLKRVKEVDPASLPDTVMVTRGKLYYSMPRRYAEILEREGIVNIQKGRREQRLFKPYKKE